MFKHCLLQFASTSLALGNPWLARLGVSLITETILGGAGRGTGCCRRRRRSRVSLCRKTGSSSTETSESMMAATTTTSCSAEVCQLLNGFRKVRRISKPLWLIAMKNSMARDTNHRLRGWIMVGDMTPPVSCLVQIYIKCAF